MTNWQPIETAPKDGEYVFLINSSIIIPVAAQYRKDFNHHWCDWYASNNEPISMYMRDGPTHWMPLPEPPEENEG